MKRTTISLEDDIFEILYSSSGKSASDYISKIIKKNFFRWKKAFHIVSSVKIENAHIKKNELEMMFAAIKETSANTDSSYKTAVDLFDLHRKHNVSQKRSLDILNEIQKNKKLNDAILSLYDEFVFQNKNLLALMDKLN